MKKLVIVTSDSRFFKVNHCDKIQKNAFKETRNTFLY